MKNIRAQLNKTATALYPERPVTPWCFIQENHYKNCAQIFLLPCNTIINCFFLYCSDGLMKPDLCFFVHQENGSYTWKCEDRGQYLK